MPETHTSVTKFGRRLEPLSLAARAAVRFVGSHGILRALRLGAAGLTMLGPRGLVRRAAAEARQREDDERYLGWLTTHTPTEEGLARLKTDIAGLAYQPRVSIITAVFNTNPLWLRRCVDSVRAQVYANWELCICDDGSTSTETIDALRELAVDPHLRVIRSARNAGIVQASNAALTLATGEFVGFLDHDDALAPDALAEIVRHLNIHRDLDVVYTDEDKIDEAGVRSQPHFKPDWSPDLLRSCMYVSHLTVMRRTLIEKTGAFRSGTDGAQDYDLMLRVSESTSRIAHIPRVLYHWRMAVDSAASSRLEKPWAVAAGRRALDEDCRRRGIRGDALPAEAAGHYRVRYAITGTPRVTILVRAPERADEQLARWQRSLERHSRYANYEMLVASDQRLNATARAAHGDHLLVLIPFAQPTSADWIEALLEFSQQSEIGAVGGIALNRDGTIDDAGLVAGGPAAALPAFRGEPRWTRGHLSNILDVRNCAAVGASCLMTRRSVFDQVGGFDESLHTVWNVDYCLRVRNVGRRAVVTPYAQVRVDQRTNFAPEELRQLQLKWSGWLDRDPYYNPNFDQRAATFRLPGVVTR